MSNTKSLETGSLNADSQRKIKLSYQCSGDPWVGLGELSNRLKGMKRQPSKIVEEILKGDLKTEEK